MGNVLVTVSDKLVQVPDANGDGNVASYNADVASAQDYYPFGMREPGRQYNAGSQYRYGFNGQEKDDDIAGSGNSYTAEYWEYDPRIGRRWNLDPKEKESPELSPYTAFNNNPIVYADPNGESGVVTFKGKTAIIDATLILYGPKATVKTGQAIADEIQQQYNNAHAQVSVSGKTYNVKVRIHYQIKSEADAYAMAKDNTSAKNNFIRVDDHLNSPDPVSKNRSEMQVGGNTGYLVTTDNLGKSTTSTHEFGHGLGLLHYSQSLLGTGQPGIMAARGTPVDKPYRLIVPNNPGYMGVDANKRVVLPSDIQNAFKNLQYKNGEWQIGTAANKFYTSDNDQTTNLQFIKFVEMQQKRPVADKSTDNTHVAPSVH